MSVSWDMTENVSLDMTGTYITRQAYMDWNSSPHIQCSVKYVLAEDFSTSHLVICKIFVAAKISGPSY